VYHTERERERKRERGRERYNKNNMSFDRAEFANSRFVNAIGERKDVQLEEAGHRPLLLSPENSHGVSDDEVGLSLSNTSTAQGTRYLFTTAAQSLGGSWKKHPISNQRMFPPENQKYIAIQCNNRKNCNQQRGFLYMVFDARPVPIETNWTKKSSCPPPHSLSKWKLVVIHKHSASAFIGFFIDSLGLFDQSKPYQLDFNHIKNLHSVQHHLYFVPVNLYSSEKGTLQHMKRLATVDVSGFLSADIRGPTIIYYKLSSNKHPPPESTTSTTTKETKKR